MRIVVKTKVNPESKTPEELIVPDNTPAQEVRRLVARKFGWVAIGVPHTWFGFRR